MNNYFTKTFCLFSLILISSSEHFPKTVATASQFGKYFDLLNVFDQCTIQVIQNSDQLWNLTHLSNWGHNTLQITDTSLNSSHNKINYAIVLGSGNISLLYNRICFSKHRSHCNVEIHVTDLIFVANIVDNIHELKFKRTHQKEKAKVEPDFKIVPGYGSTYNE